MLALIVLIITEVVVALQLFKVIAISYHDMLVFLLLAILVALILIWFPDPWTRRTP